MKFVFLNKNTVGQTQIVLLAFVQATASKLCLPTGEWYRNEENYIWTNYTLCITETIITVTVDLNEDDDNPLLLVSTLN